MQKTVGGDQLRASRPSNEFLNKRRPLLSCNGGGAENLRENRLILQFRSKYRRQNQVDLVILQLRQLLDEEDADSFLVNPVSVAYIVQDPCGQLARPFEFGGQSFN